MPATYGVSIWWVGTAFPVWITSVSTSPLRARISLPATIAASRSVPEASPSSPAASAVGTMLAPEWAMKVQSSHSRIWAWTEFISAACRAEVRKPFAPITVASSRSPNPRTARPNFRAGGIREPAQIAPRMLINCSLALAIAPGGMSS